MRLAEEAERRKGGDGSGPSGLPDGFVRACLRTNQHGGGVLFKALSRGRFAYCKSWEVGYMDRVEVAVEAVAQAYEAWVGEARAEFGGENQRAVRQKAKWRLVNQLERRAEQLRGGNRRQRCLKFAHNSENPLAMVGGERDASQWRLPCKTGVIGLN